MAFPTGRIELFRLSWLTVVCPTKTTKRKFCTAKPKYLLVWFCCSRSRNRRFCQSFSWQFLTNRHPTVYSTRKIPQAKSKSAFCTIITTMLSPSHQNFSTSRNSVPRAKCSWMNLERSIRARRSVLYRVICVTVICQRKNCIRDDKTVYCRSCNRRLKNLDC